MRACRGFIRVALAHAGCRGRFGIEMRLVALVAEKSRHRTRFRDMSVAPGAAVIGDHRGLFFGKRMAV